MQCNYKRSKGSTSNARLREIIKSERWDELNKTNSIGVPVYTYDVLKPIIAEFRAAGEAAVQRVREVPESEWIDPDGAPNPDFSIPYDEAVKMLSVVWCLTNKRSLPGMELGKIWSYVRGEKSGKPDEPDEQPDTPIFTDSGTTDPWIHGHESMGPPQ